MELYFGTQSLSLFYIVSEKKTTCLNRALVEAVFSPQQEVGKLSLLQVLKIQAVNMYAVYN